jgi:ParB-like chromosome segregation protein Spo0J
VIPPSTSPGSIMQQTQQYYGEGQLSLPLPGFEDRIQWELDLGIQPRKKGNPNFTAKWLSKTAAIRLPKRFIDKVVDFCQKLERGENPIEIRETIKYIERDREIIPVETTGIREIPVESLKVDPKRFQYKILHGSAGSTGSLSGIKNWNKVLAGIIMVWIDPVDDNTYVVNGHNRYALAKHLGIKTVTVKFLECETAKDARQIGAMANIAEGRGTVIDAAKLFRDTGWDRANLEVAGISLKEKIASDGLALARLDNLLFDKTIHGELPTDWAVAIGEKLSDHSKQIELWKLLQKERRKISTDTISELAEIVESAGTQETSQMTLFGLEIASNTLAIEKAELQAWINQRLRRDARLFNSAAKNSQTLEKGNNRIDKSSSKAIADRAAIAYTIFNELKNVSGPVSTAINNAAAKISSGNSVHIKDELYSYILSLADHPLAV